MNEYLKVIEPIMYTVITVLLPVVFAVIRDYLIEKNNKLANEIDNDLIKQYYYMATDMVDEVVQSVSQTYVDTLKKNGTFNKEAQEEAKNIAIATLKTLIIGDIKNAVEKLYGDFNTWLDVEIEHYVNYRK